MSRNVRRKFFVNGRYLGRPVTGVERFAHGIVGALDEMIADKDVQDWTVLTPPGGAAGHSFARLKIVECGRLKGHAWEQLDLLHASRNGVLINFCNSGPVFHKRQLTVIHDALVYRFPDNFSPIYRTLHRGLGYGLSRHSRLLTVSEFSRRELTAVFGVPSESIGIIPNAVDHLAAVQSDASILERLDLVGRPFLLFVGSPARNKNLMAAIEAFRPLAENTTFVLVGAAAKSFSQNLSMPLPLHCLRPGRLSDEELKALYLNATALVFPSTYEGFGIPPLEAMSLGCPVLAADIAVVREVCDSAAVYFDPNDISSIRAAMQRAIEWTEERKLLVTAGRERAAHYSWKRSAGLLLQETEVFGR